MAHPPVLILVTIRGDGLTDLGLLELQIGVGELTGGFVDEGRRTHGRFAQRQHQNFIGPIRRDVPQPRRQHFPHQRLGEHFRRVVGGGLGPVDAVQMQDELALPVDAWLPGAAFEDDLAGSEHIFQRFRHKPGRQIGGNRIIQDASRRAAAGRRRNCVRVVLLVIPCLLVIGARFLVLGRTHLDQVFGGEKALPGKQTFINRAQLHDTEVAIVNPANRAGFLIDAHRQTADDLLQHPVGQPGPVQQGRGLRVEQRRGERLDGEMLGPPHLQRFPPTGERQRLLAAAEQIVLMGEQWRIGGSRIRRRSVLAEALVNECKQFP